MTGDGFEARSQRSVATHDEWRHELGDLVTDRIRVAEHARRVAHGGPRLDGGERDDLRDVVPAVAIGGVLDHLAAVAGVEVHVDVGHLLAARVQEPFEQEVVADRVDVDDAQAVGDARTRRAPASGAHPDASRPGVADEIPHDQEVGREPHGLDDAELELDAFEHFGPGRDAVARLGAFDGELSEVGVFVVTLRRRERGQHRVAELDLDVGALGDEQCVVARLLVVREQVAHLLRRLQVELVGVELEALGIALHRAGLHAEQRVMRLGVFAVRVVAVVRGEQRRAHVARQADELRVDLELLGQSVILQLDEERVAPEDRLESVDQDARALVIVLQQSLRHRTAQATGGGDEPFVVLLEQLEVGAGLLEEAVEVRVRGDLDQVAVPLRALGQQREVEDVVLVASRPIVATGGDHVGLGADDGRDTGVARGAVEVEDAIHVAVVGDAHRRLTIGRRPRHDVGDPGRAVEHGELGVQVEMDERLRQRRLRDRYEQACGKACGQITPV